MNPGPHRVDENAPVFRPDNTVTVVPVTPTFYQDLEERFDGFSGHVLVQRFEFSDPWPTWETHPNGDEFVYLLSGDVDFVLWIDAEQIVRVHEPGSYVVVPKGTWHTARPRAPTSMLFVTPGEGTLNAERPG